MGGRIDLAIIAIVRSYRSWTLKKAGSHESDGRPVWPEWTDRTVTSGQDSWLRRCRRLGTDSTSKIHRQAMRPHPSPGRGGAAARGGKWKLDALRVLAALVITLALSFAVAHQPVFAWRPRPCPTARMVLAHGGMQGPRDEARAPGAARGGEPSQQRTRQHALQMEQLQKKQLQREQLQRKQLHGEQLLLQQQEEHAAVAFLQQLLGEQQQRQHQQREQQQPPPPQQQQQLQEQQHAAVAFLQQLQEQQQQKLRQQQQQEQQQQEQQLAGQPHLNGQHPVAAPVHEPSSELGTPGVAGKSSDAASPTKQQAQQLVAQEPAAAVDSGSEAANGQVDVQEERKHPAEQEQQQQHPGTADEEGRQPPLAPQQQQPQPQSPPQPQPPAEPDAGAAALQGAEEAERALAAAPPGAPPPEDPLAALGQLLADAPADWNPLGRPDASGAMVGGAVLLRLEELSAVVGDLGAWWAAHGRPQVSGRRRERGGGGGCAAVGWKGRLAGVCLRACVAAWAGVRILSARPASWRAGPPT